MTLVLYDFPSQKLGAWSPNTCKTRICLNYKGIPFTTRWIEYPDVARTLQALGGAPTSRNPVTGADLYTLPALHDPATGETVTDSVRIAAYLDARFPDAPRLFPFDGARAAVELFDAWFLGSSGLQPSLSALMRLQTCEALNAPSAEFYRRTREAQFGCRMEETAPAGSARRAELWDTAKKALSSLAQMLDANGIGANGEEKPWFFGDAFSFADAILAGYLVWARLILGEDSEEWKALAGWDGGRWGRVVKFAEKYTSSCLSEA